MLFVSSLLPEPPPTNISIGIHKWTFYLFRKTIRLKLMNAASNYVCCHNIIVVLQFFFQRNNTFGFILSSLCSICGIVCAGLKRERLRWNKPVVSHISEHRSELNV